jgi:hypothetical protein
LFGRYDAGEALDRISSLPFNQTSPSPGTDSRGFPERHNELLVAQCAFVVYVRANPMRDTRTTQEASP